MGKQVLGVDLDFDGNSLLSMGEESISASSVLSPPSFAVNQNNYAPVGIQTASLVRLVSSAVKYDFWNGFKELMNRKFGCSLKVDLDESHDICSDYVSTYQVELKMVTDDFFKVRIAFPQDSFRYMSENVIVID